ncbi:MAG: methyltransferase domain-containing protein [Aquimonas sp.]|nr:methyltransferase domain-containing protein [Aquimonas sp.]
MTVRETRSAAWNSYWASGVLHSCAGSFAGNYDQGLSAFWRAAFAELHSEARVLDIGCGNGPLELLMVEALGPDQLPWVDAVDLAQPVPPFLATLPEKVRERLRFHGGVAAEQLPFKAECFDLVISQYGIEYSELEHSLAEAKRVLNPAGGFALVLHHAQSLPVRRGREELAHLDWLLSARSLLDRAEALVPWLAQLSRPGGRERLQASAEAAADRESYNESVRALAERAAVLPTPDLLHEAQSAVASALSEAAMRGLDPGLGALQALRSELELARLRQRELVDCALDAEAVAGMVKALVGPGSRAHELAEVRIQGELFGWTLRIRSTV